MTECTTNFVDQVLGGLFSQTIEQVQLCKFSTLIVRSMPGTARGIPGAFIHQGEERGRRDNEVEEREEYKIGRDKAREKEE